MNSLFYVSSLSIAFSHFVIFFFVFVRVITKKRVFFSISTSVILLSSSHINRYNRNNSSYLLLKFFDFTLTLKRNIFFFVV
ncbi:hypothetical protein STCU_11222 [Strigomonas culicis]|uniref:Uncharacterized protein n=1 Tax=Strigomonas culicis TaxID=28005 RepID=S9V0Z2_9TRYP|nr:hypothetical protein STCU_11222 [Strigomonas culicis]|eukprot:EPY16475.1 hypothetical protein STCU_11222 [Strigomonas culicis]